ncbi:MAG: AMMECR1 domain-containing protein [Coriobacteriales bacterium]|jgi:AMMECR1 domain-containing protein|nr:AMMECR1 domain-containing protein [Coriobacteriales bacterium]
MTERHSLPVALAHAAIASFLKDGQRPTLATPAIAALLNEAERVENPWHLGKHRFNHCTPSSGQFAPDPSGQTTPLPQVVASLPQTDPGQIDSESDALPGAPAELEGAKRLSSVGWEALIGASLALCDLRGRRAGAFVSLHNAATDALRGCIGTISGTQDNVLAEIVHNAISAASEDPRFSPLRPEELEGLEISVDVLGDAEPVARLESLAQLTMRDNGDGTFRPIFRVGSGVECDSRKWDETYRPHCPSLDAQRYGVIVSSGWRRGLLLPALDGVDTPLQQVSIALAKAGIGTDEPFQLERFEVVRYR